MDKFKHQFICILICLVIGLFIGHFVHKKITGPDFEKIENEKKKLKHEIDSLSRSNDSLDNRIKNLDLIHKLDSVKIKNYNFRVQADGVRVKKKLDSLDKLTPSEKHNWILNRYSPKR